MVTVRTCRSYDSQEIHAAVDRLTADLGGFSPYIRPGETVLLKVNLIMASGPEKAATTHPAFVEALAEKLVRYGCKVYIGDSPGGPFTVGMLRHIYKETGMEDAARESGAELSFDTGQTVVSFPQGQLLKSITMTSMCRSVDKVISVCKLKTHSMMTYTGAVKNLFGTIPGLMKSEYHVRMPQMTDFAGALLDICEAVHPVLSFMDAVIGMEGNGPTSGKPRAIGCVLASPSPYELDRTAAGLIGLTDKDVPTLAAAKQWGLCPDRISLLGDDVQQFTLTDYQLPDNIHTDLTKGGFMPYFLMKRLRPRVQFDHSKCIGCGHCAANCPAKVITMKNHFPSVDYSRCIRCYCCQELCPQHAVSIHESAVYRWANGIGKKKT